MKRLAMLLSAALLAGSLAMFTSVSPASAHTDACAGQGTATVGSGLTYPLPNLPAKLTTFTFGFGLGVCGSGASLSASGTVHGFCGFSFGAGTTSNSHTFKWLGVGGTLYLYGHVTGAVNAAPDPTVGLTNSCTTGATAFLVNGAAALVHLV